MGVGAGTEETAPPLIIDENGSLIFFRSVDSAESYLEVTDVENGEYVGYDSRGRLLALTVEMPRARGLARLFGTPAERVVIGLAELDSSHSAQLRQAARAVPHGTQGPSRRLGYVRTWRTDRLGAAARRPAVAHGKCGWQPPDRGPSGLFLLVAHRLPYR